MSSEKPRTSRRSPVKKPEGTRRQVDAKRTMREQGKALRAWMDERREKAEKRHVERPLAPGGHGLTPVMRAIVKPDPVPFHVNEFPAGKGYANTPYVKPLESLRSKRKGSRRLRKELMPQDEIVVEIEPKWPGVLS